MNKVTQKTTLALAIATAISLIGISGCSTKETNIISEDEKQPVKQQIVKTLKPATITEEMDQSSAGDSVATAPVVERLIQNQSARQQLQESKLAKGVHKRKSEQRIQQSNHFSAPALRTMPTEKPNRENYAHIDRNTIKQVADSPVSTFSIDVDTGAYTNVRRILNQGQLPRTDAVRAEEFINYFNYDYKPPADKDIPFAVHTDMMVTPWNKNSYLLQLGIKAWEPSHLQRPAANLVFLLDVSGSMNSPDKLGLLKKSLMLLTRKLNSNDRISIAVYAGASGIVLEPTPGNQIAQIEAALQQLQAGGSTNGAAGIKLAYQLAEHAFIKDGINRILLATDGDFNVGTTNFNALTDLVEEKRKSGIALSTLGFGSGNYNDHLMEQLADKGNGQYSYIDSLLEARKVLVDEMNSSLLTVAGDVKIQLEFNPNQVAEYRLIGYENRALAREDFNNDKVDAGEIGAGHTVTALYEIHFKDSNKLSADPLRYQQNQPNSKSENSSDISDNELGYLKLRYKNPGDTHSQLIKKALNKKQLLSKATAPSDNIRFAASVAAFAQQLTGGKYLENFDYQQIHQLAQSSKSDDSKGIRGEFLQLISLAELLSQQRIDLQKQGE